MQFNSISDFLDALETRMDELKGQQSITSSTDMVPGVPDSDLEEINLIVDEASNIFDNVEDIIEFLHNHLINKGYTEDQITQIIDYFGLE